MIQHLHEARGTLSKGLNLSQLAAAMQVSDLQLEPVIEALGEYDYVNAIADGSGRYVLLCEPENIAMTPLIEKLLLASSPVASRFLQRSGVSMLNGRDVL